MLVAVIGDTFQITFQALKDILDNVVHLPCQCGDDLHFTDDDDGGQAAAQAGKWDTGIGPNVQLQGGPSGDSSSGIGEEGGDLSSSSDGSSSIGDDFSEYSFSLD